MHSTFKGRKFSLLHSMLRQLSLSLVRNQFLLFFLFPTRHPFLSSSFPSFLPSLYARLPPSSPPSFLPPYPSLHLPSPPTLPRPGLYFALTKNRDVSNGHPLARSLAPLTRSLAPQCSIRSRDSLRSLLRSLAHSLDPELVIQWNIFIQFSKCPESL